MTGIFTDELIRQCESLDLTRAGFLMSPAEKRAGRINFRRRLRDLTEDQLRFLLEDKPEDAFCLLDWADQELTGRDEKSHVWGWESYDQQITRIHEMIGQLKQ